VDASLSSVVSSDLGTGQSRVRVIRQDDLADGGGSGGETRCQSDRTIEMGLERPSLFFSSFEHLSPKYVYNFIYTHLCIHIYVFIHTHITINSYIHIYDDLMPCLWLQE
jgi:hypothetical protein